MLYFVAGSQAPQTAPIESLKGQFGADVLLVRHELAKAPAAEDGAPAASKFGFRWFWTELLRHKRIWRDVLLASFFIQLIGLTTPIGTQVVIDKVVVHQTESTLIAIAMGLGMFLLFSSNALQRVRVLRYAVPAIVPCWNYTGTLPLTPEQIASWAILDTFDALSPRYDSPQSEETLAAWCNEAGLEDVQIKATGNGIVGNARKP
jgi:hypothetical protein